MIVDLKPLRDEDEGERLVCTPDPKRLSPPLTAKRNTLPHNVFRTVDDNGNEAESIGT
jgi:hypothetical protein